MGIKLQNISKQFGTFRALNDISLEIKQGELVALLGPSGSGKTTLLRIIAGLEIPDEGHIYFGERNATTMQARERRVGFVFQHYALFRHMTIYENIAFGLTVKRRRERPSKAEINERVMALLKLIQLDWLADRYPMQLSGGQRQRVALARALAVEPKVLLLDEPFGALDAKVRLELRRWLRKLHDEIQITSVFVTHDQEEALELADRVVVMNNGNIEQIGSPEEVYGAPSSPFVYNFLGKVNLFHGRIGKGKFYVGNVELAYPENAGLDSETAICYVRPHLVSIENKQNGNSGIEATIHFINKAGPLVHIELQTNWGDPFIAEISQERFRELQLEVGKNVFVTPHEFRIYTDKTSA